MKTKTPFTKISELTSSWFIIDAAGKPLGRLASEIAKKLIGKQKVSYVPNLPVGDFVIVINAKDVKIASRAMAQKIYFRHTGFPGGLRETPLDVMLEKHPERMIELAVKNMLPHTKLGKKIFTRLKVYKDSKHGHEAQKPQLFS